jgi:minor extracellular serine protease Vpr
MVLALAAVAAVAVGLTGASGATGQLGRFKTIPGGPITGSHSALVPLALSNKLATYILELRAKPVAVVDAASKNAGHGALNYAQKAHVARQIRSQQAPVISAVQQLHRARVTERYVGVYNGISVTLPQREAWKLSSIRGVKAVFAAKTYTLATGPGDGIPITRAPQTWDGVNGYTGAGIKIADLDTGIDYTHADFGGSGNPADYTCALANDTVDPSTVLCGGHPMSDYIGPTAPKIKGGTDLVGDAYDASGFGSALIPQPDSNPLDCNSHGTHTAGTLAGFGVTSNGHTYTGPYNKKTINNHSFAIPPGMAPKASLYSVRVFGCNGSVDNNVLLAAMDWAFVHHMDVVNMSLGAPFGSPSDPDSAAASNLAAEGVITVVASGNEGPSPYMTGSPGVGVGALSVAASDTTQAFPGAALTLTKSNLTPGGSLTAIDANGLTIPAGTYDLKVIYSSPGVLSLGCSVADDGGASSLPANTVIVVARGTCARVAKAIFGQQAGAAGVIMVNNESGYPPYEGPITSNPDDNVPYTVTIPFLGVEGDSDPSSSANGAQLIASDGGTVHLAATSIANPGYRSLAGFSSWGPSPGGILKPEVTAPGVSIISAGMGTGNGILIDSGTSMATPHTAGEAALVKQAHPTWHAVKFWKDAIVNTASSARVAGYSVRGAGAGFIDAYKATHTDVVAGGSPTGTASLSFGAPDMTSKFTATRWITLRNFGTKKATFTVVATSKEGLPHSIVLDSGNSWSPRKITVPAGGKKFIAVQLNVFKKNALDPASAFNYWWGDGHFADAAGLIKFKPMKGSNHGIALSVPYYVVPTAVSNVTISGVNSQALSNGKTDPVKLTNKGGLRLGLADWFSWGGNSPVSKADIGSADLLNDGVQSFPKHGYLVFALNTTKAWTNPAEDFVEIDVDVDHDGIPDYAVLSVDSGAFFTGSPNGEAVVVVYDFSNGHYSVDFLTSAMFNGTTMELPVLFSQLCQGGPCISSTPIRYYTFMEDRNGGLDFIVKNARFNVMAPPLLNHGTDFVSPNHQVIDPTVIVPAAWAATPQRGIYVIAQNNQNTVGEAFTFRLHF